MESNVYWVHWIKLMFDCDMHYIVPSLLDRKECNFLGPKQTPIYQFNLPYRRNRARGLNILRMIASLLVVFVAFAYANDRTNFIYLGSALFFFICCLRMDDLWIGTDYIESRKYYLCGLVYRTRVVQGEALTQVILDSRYEKVEHEYTGAGCLYVFVPDFMKTFAIIITKPGDRTARPWKFFISHKEYKLIAELINTYRKTEYAEEGNR